MVEQIGGVLDKRATLKNNVNNVTVNITNNVNNVINRSDHRAVESIARRLVEKFGSEESFKFYVLVAYKLPESRIWLHYESSLKGKNPAGLFNWLCRKDMKDGF